MKKILVFGVFDGIHPGHFYFLNSARRFGILTVAVARDKVVVKLKGKKPEKKIALRIRDVRKTGLADKIAMGDTKIGSWKVVEKVKPDVILLGYDQRALKKALYEHKTKTGAGFKVQTLKSYKPEKYHSSIIKKHAGHSSYSLKPGSRKRRSFQKRRVS